MTRVTFGGHAGAVHRPAAPAGLALVLCPPVGREARVAYRPLWQLAGLLAEAGVAVLRYDHLGVGDSAPLDQDADQWLRWQAGVAEAAAFARAHLGANQLVLAGLRLGGSLAAAAAEAVHPDGLLLMDPVISGKGWLREQRIAAAMLRGDGEPPAPSNGGLEADGLTLSAATVSSLQAFDLRGVSGSCEVFLASPNRSGRLPQGWTGSLEIAPFDEFDTLFQEAHVNAPPDTLFAAAREWTVRLARTSASAEVSRLPPARLATRQWVERPVTFGNGLQGVLCLPRDRGGERAVAMGNTGGDPRAGIGDFGTHACRALASQGVAALRFDFAGLGESPAADGAWRSHVYEESRTADFAAAADLLAAKGYTDVVLAGVCSAAHHALHGAIADPRVSAVFAINTAKLVWRPGDLLAPSAMVAEPGPRGSLRGLRRAATWRRILTGDAQVGRILRARVTALWGAFGRHERPETRELRSGLRRLSARGGRAKMLIGRGDSAHGELEAHFGWNGLGLGRLRKAVAVSIAPRLDHGLFFPESRELAIRELVDFCLAPGRPGAVGARRRAGEEAPGIRGERSAGAFARSPVATRPGGLTDSSQPHDRH